MKNVTEVASGACEKHGPFQGEYCYLLDSDGSKSYSHGPHCPACELEREDANRKRWEAERLKKWQQAVESAGIPLRFQSALFDNYRASTPEQRGVLADLRNYADQFQWNNTPSNSALLIGRPGTGKSHLAIALCVAFLEKIAAAGEMGKTYYWRGGAVRYVQAADIFSEIRETFRQDAKRSEAEIMERLRNVGLLVVDEVGFQGVKDFEHRVMFQVIDSRYRNQKPTVIVSNGNIPLLKEQYGEQFMDRMREVGNLVLPFDWESYRQREPAQSPRSDKSRNVLN